MQAALAGFAALPPPPSRTRVCTRLHGACARRAANAGKTAVVQRIVRQALLADIFPNLLLGPIAQRTQFVPATAGVPLDGHRHATAGRLSAPYPGNPSAAARNGASEGFHFA